MKDSSKDKITNLESALENALDIGDENEVENLLNLLTKFNNCKDAETSSIQSNSKIDIMEEKDVSNKPLPLKDFSIDNIQHSLQEALEQGNAKMVDYYMFLLGQGV